MLPAVLEQVAVPRLDGGPPRRNPDMVIADKAYSAASNRRGRLGGRPPAFDKVQYKRRNVVERAFNKANTGARSRLAMTSSP